MYGSHIRWFQLKKSKYLCNLLNFDIFFSFIFYIVSYEQVAERALFLWNNDHIRNLMNQNRKVILPIIFPSLEKNTRSHWNQAVQSLTLNVRKAFSDEDQLLFDECLHKFEQDEENERKLQEKRQWNWKRLEDAAASRAIIGAC